ncbi:MAG: hypothetical protein R2815_11570 [Flavobacteriales bacterium]
MKDTRKPSLLLASTCILLCGTLLWSTSCNSSDQRTSDPTVTNETATKVLEQLDQEAAEARQAAEKAGVPEETIEAMEQSQEDRRSRLEQQNSDSPYKGLSGAEIEAMMEELLEKYLADPSTGTYETVMNTFREPMVKQYYDNNGPEVKARRKAIVDRMKAAKAGGSE